MWMLESFGQIPLKKPFLIFSVTLGAAFLLLAHFFSLNPLSQPALYALIAADVCIAWNRRQRLVRAAVACGLSFALAMWTLAYLPLFSLGFALITGLIAFPESFRAWKWLIVSTLVFAAIFSTSVWQQIYFFGSAIPQQLLPILHASAFSFCLLIAFCVYLLEKDRVQQAYDHYQWKPGSEEAGIAAQTLAMYGQLKGRLPKEQLQEFVEKIIHLSHQLQEVSADTSRVDPESLERQIGEMQEKQQSMTDAVAAKQYKQALQNKIRQREHYAGLIVQSERIRAQILNYLSALENIRLAYANRDYKDGGENRDTVEFFMNMAKMQAESACDNAEAYERLSAN